MPEDKEKQYELFCEMERHLLEDHNPSDYFNSIPHDRLALAPFDVLGALKTTEQSPKHHPEGNVWNHTMLVINQAAVLKEKSQNPKVLMWAALLHDIGKPPTSKVVGNKITSYNHDKVGAVMTETFLRVFSDDVAFINDVRILVRWHMQILFVVNGTNFADINHMREEVDTEEVALLGTCDRLGRLGADRKKEENNILLFLQKVKGF